MECHAREARSTDLEYVMSVSCEVKLWRHGTKMDQRIIDESVKQWRTRLRACVASKGGQFEHKL